MSRADIFQGRHAWAYDWRRQGERTPEAIAATCTEYGITAFQCEVRYGRVWQADIGYPAGRVAPDLDDYGPHTLAGVLELRDRLASAGVQLIPVFVPRGLPGEAQDHGAIAAALGAGVVDLEYEGYGDPATYQYWNADPALIEVYARELRQAAPDAALAWQPDGRNADSGRSREWDQVIAAAAPYVDVMAPQLYAGWPAYGDDLDTVMKDAARFDKFKSLGLPVAPTLYTSEGMRSPALLWRIVRGDALGFCAFRFGAMGPDQLTVVESLAVSAPVVPPPSGGGVDAGTVLVIADGVHDLSVRAAVQEQAIREYAGTLGGK